LVEQFGVQLMPFDGFLLVSHVMVAKEAHTSVLVKDLLIATVGVGNAQWEGKYSDSKNVTNVWHF
jgi:enoyl reductase-like protein